MLKKIREFVSQKGQGVVEYALLLGFVAVVMVAFTSSSGLTNTLRTTLQNIMAQFTTLNEAYGGGSGDDDNLTVPPGEEDEEAD